MRTQVVAAITIAVALTAGCGSAANEADGAAADQTRPPIVEPTVEASEPVTPKPTPTSPPPVSMDTACDLLGSDSTMTRAADEVGVFVKHPDGSQTDAPRLRRIVKDLDFVAERAPEKLAVHLRATEEPLTAIADSIETGTNRTVDLQSYRAGGIEVLNICGVRLFPS